jgi:hypothetical protein
MEADPAPETPCFLTFLPFYRILDDGQIPKTL